jgi:hypothetical protein
VSSAVLRALREGKSMQEISALTDMQGSSPEKLVRNLVDVCCEGKSDIDPNELIPLAFSNKGKHCSPIRPNVSKQCPPIAASSLCSCFTLECTPTMAYVLVCPEKNVIVQHLGWGVSFNLAVHMLLQVLERSWGPKS